MLNHARVYCFKIGLYHLYHLEAPNPAYHEMCFMGGLATVAPISSAYAHPKAPCSRCRGQLQPSFEVAAGTPRESLTGFRLRCACLMLEGFVFWHRLS